MKFQNWFRYGRIKRYERVDMMDYDSSDEDTFEENFKSTISLRLIAINLGKTIPWHLFFWCQEYNYWELIILRLQNQLEDPSHLDSLPW